MAPEVIKQTGHGMPADVWSLGCTLLEMLTAKPPWSHFPSPISALFHIAQVWSHTRKASPRHTRKARLRLLDRLSLTHLP